MDAIVLKQFPNVDGFFASMPAKQTGGFAPKWGKSHPPLYIHNNSWDGKALSAFPIKVSKKLAPYIENLSYTIMDKLSENVKKGSKGWNYIMWELKKLAKIDVNSPVFPPISFCPLPAWLSKGKCYSIEYPTRLKGYYFLFGFPLSSIFKIFKESYIVQHFFESAFQNAEKKGDDFFNKLQEETLLAQEAKYILGKEWKNILNEA